jgi:hypothetical protein
MYEGLIARIGNFREIKGADFIISADIIINDTVITQVVTSKNTPNNALGIYFCADIQLSEDYCKANNLLLLKDENGNKIAGSGYLDSEKRRITAQRFKGVKSDGLWMPIESLDYIQDNSKTPSQSFKEGDKIADYMRSDAVLIPIARRYPKATVSVTMSKSGRVQKDLETFPKHYDTEQFMYCLSDIERIPVGTELYITEKLHGTSHRVGVVKHSVAVKWYHKLVNRVFKHTFLGYEYKLTHGTRNVILADDSIGFHGKEEFRYAAVGYPELPEDVILYGEIVGYAHGKPIMSEHSTKDVPELKRRYGATVTYHYGLEDTAKFYVYRASVDGVDLSVEESAELAAEHGYSFVPVLYRGTWEGDIQALVKLVEGFTPDTAISALADHPIEGVCIRIGNRVWKHKTFSFKVMEGIVKPTEIENEG